MTSRKLTALAFASTLVLGAGLTACQDDDGASVREIEDDGTGGTGTGTGTGTGATGTGTGATGTGTEGTGPGTEAGE